MLKFITALRRDRETIRVLAERFDAERADGVAASPRRATAVPLPRVMAPSWGVHNRRALAG